ncbi:MAG TPA: hypothetical protein VKV04_12875 [Verrucomicrobiae bacterium]|nr:hypothetical protein [Verrucomicrobiae bacterium]
MDDYYIAAAKETLNKLSPATRAFLVANAAEKRKIVVNSMLRQVHECPWASMEVKRQENKVTIEWAIKSSAGNPDRYIVTGTVADIALLPRPENYSHSFLHTGKGDGSVNLELEEGHSYYFEFTFLDEDEYNAGVKRGQRGGTTGTLVDTILFLVGIPLSDERKELLRKAVKITSDPSEMVRHEIEQRMNLANTFDEMLKKAVEQIKAMELSQSEKEERIDQLKEDIERLKDRYGM